MKNPSLFTVQSPLPKTKNARFPTCKTRKMRGNKGKTERGGFEPPLQT